jgi:hypothetical protein
MAKSGATPRASIRSFLGWAWTRRRKLAEGYLTKQGAQRELDAILTDARRNHLTGQTATVRGVMNGSLPVLALTQIPSI